MTRRKRGGTFKIVGAGGSAFVAGLMRPDARDPNAVDVTPGQRGAGRPLADELPGPKTHADSRQVSLRPGDLAAREATARNRGLIGEALAPRRFR